MPNGHANERAEVYRVSRFWGVIYDIGDTAFYVGLIGALTAPVSYLGVSNFGSQPRQGQLQILGWAILQMPIIVFLGVLFGTAVKGLARRVTGVGPHG
jgi:hypothetical protein